jgi:hypothetical protein
MWVILVDTEISIKRDNKISEIFDVLPAYSTNYLMKNVNKYSQTSYLLNALIFKTESGAQRIVDDFNNKTIDEKKSYKSSFIWIYNYHLSVKKLTQSEWVKYINDKIDREKIKFQRATIKHQKNLIKLEKQKTSYK